MAAASQKALSDRQGEGGFLALDALIGLLIVALGVIAAVEAGSQVEELSRSALDMRLGAAQAADLMVTEWPKLGRPGAVDGDRGHGLAAWSLTATAQRALAHSALSVCRVEVVVTIKGSAHRTTLETQRLCAAGT